MATRHLLNVPYINFKNTSKFYELQQVLKLKIFLHLKGKTKVSVGNNFLHDLELNEYEIYSQEEYPITLTVHVVIPTVCEACSLKGLLKGGKQNPSV